LGIKPSILIPLLWSKIKIAILLIGILPFLNLISCKKNESSCEPNDNALFYIFMNKGCRMFNPDLTDTTGYFANIYKSNAGAKMPVLEINGHNISLADDGYSRCNGGSKFETGSHKIANAHQAGYFLLGQTNKLKLVGDRCGTINENFELPNEIRMKPLSSGIIHRNSDLVLEITGASDYPFPIPINDDPSSQFDRISLFIFYSRSISDTIAYPSLPAQPAVYGQEYKAGSGQIVVPASQLKTFPLNGRIIIRLLRDTQFKLANQTKGELFIQCDQQQGEYFIIND
jgi:hypothetical protein